MKEEDIFYKSSTAISIIFLVFLMIISSVVKAHANADIKSNNCVGDPPANHLMPLSAPTWPLHPRYGSFELTSMPFNERDIYKIHKLYKDPDIACWADSGDKVAEFFVATDPLRARSFQGIASQLPGPNPARTFKYLALSAGLNCKSNICLIEKGGCMHGLPESQYIFAIMNANKMASNYDRNLVISMLQCSIKQNFDQSVKFLNLVKSGAFDGGR